MRINRGRFRNGSLPQNPITPTNPPVEEAEVIPVGYNMSDFGENAINQHWIGDESHSHKNQVIFNYVTKDFRDRCTSFESYKTVPYNGFVGDELAACANLNADIVYTPYVNAARWTNTDNANFILTVGSHYCNDGQSPSIIGSDNNRHDITVNANTFLSDSIAVSARRDTPELFKDSTSEGFGMEFFEDCSTEALDPYYPNKDIPTALSQVITDETGTILTTQENPGFTQYTFVGDILSFHTGEEPYETITVTEIIDGNSIRVSPALTPNQTAWQYIYHNVTLGQYIFGQAQSWAVPLVAGKLKVIKMTTLADWDTVRAAARATAKRNPTGIPEIDNSNWDIYRGFGCIDVQSAIQYINNL